MSKVKTLEPLAVSVAQAAQMLGLSRPSVYQLIGQNGFPAFKVGGRTLISTQGLREWVKAQAESGREAES